MKHPRIEVRLAQDSQWYYVVTARNGQVLVVSETYTRREDAHRGVKALKRAMLVAGLKGSIEQVD